MGSIARTLPVLSLLLGAITAQTVGRLAPDLVFDHRYHFGEIEAKRLGELRGSVVLVEFWGSHCEYCRSEVPHLNLLHRTRLDAGLVVIGITPERPEVVEPYLKSHRVRFPIAIGDVAAYALTSVPDAVLIAADGKILWRGRPYHLDDATIDKALKGARPAHVAPGLEAVHELRRKNQHGDAANAMEILMTNDKLGARAHEQALGWSLGYDRAIKAALKLAERDRDQDPYAVWAALQPIAEHYGAISGANEVRRKLTDLMADNRRRREIDAGRKLAEAIAKEEQLDFDAADALCKEVVLKYASTRAGKNAAALREGYQRDGKLGYQHACDRCKVAGAACAEHRRRPK
jgi:thiol-disulfide isomerase/thioredoxin